MQRRGDDAGGRHAAVGLHGRIDVEENLAEVGARDDARNLDVEAMQHANAARRVGPDAADLLNLWLGLLARHRRERPRRQRHRAAAEQHRDHQRTTGDESNSRHDDLLSERDQAAREMPAPQEP